MHFRALSTTIVVAVALSASSAVSAPVPRDVGVTVEGISFAAPLAGPVLVARGKSKPVKAPAAPVAPANPAPGSGLQMVEPTKADNMVANQKGVNGFLSPADDADKKKLNKGLDDAAAGRVGTHHTVDKNGNVGSANDRQKTGLRLDGQAGAPAGVQANVQVQQNGVAGKTTCATCVVHDGSKAGGPEVKDALQKSSDSQQIAHLWRRMIFAI